MTLVVRLIFFFLTSISIFSQEIVFVKGSVQVADSKEGQYTAVSKGKTLDAAIFLKTGSDSLAIVSFPSGSTLKVDPDTIVEINELDNEEAESSSTSIFHLIKGAILTKFTKGKGRDLIVENEHVALAVRGTEFFFGEDEGQAYAAVRSGEIAVIRKGDYDYESLKAGKALIIENKKELTKPDNFDWARNLNWDTSGVSVNSRSGFKSEKLRKLRREEFGNRIKKLRKRRKNIFKGQFRERIRKAKKRKEKRIEKKANRVQKFKNRMKKRRVLRPRRN